MSQILNYKDMKQWKLAMYWVLAVLNAIIVIDRTHTFLETGYSPWNIVFNILATVLFIWAIYDWNKEDKKYKHWFEVSFIYKSPEGTRLFEVRTQIALEERDDILKPRLSKKRITPVHKIQGAPKHLLCNGVVNMEVQAYLGYLKN